MAPTDGSIPPVRNEEGIRLTGFATDVVMTLTSDPERVEQLKDKLDEYCERIQTFDDGPPEQMGSEEISLSHKIPILCRLIHERQISAYALARGMDAHLDRFDQWEFKTAWIVVSDFNETGGQNVESGTGLGRHKPKPN